MYQHAKSIVHIEKNRTACIHVCVCQNNNHVANKSTNTANSHTKTSTEPWQPGHNLPAGSTFSRTSHDTEPIPTPLLSTTHMQHEVRVCNDKLDQPQQDVLVGTQRLVRPRQLECGGHLGQRLWTRQSNFSAEPKPNGLFIHSSLFNLKVFTV